MSSKTTVKLLFIVLITIRSLVLNGQDIQGLPFYTYFSTQDYNGGIQNWSITQNEDGLIYIANNFGLLEFDGSSWHRYSLPSVTKTRDVSIGKNGEIYVASQGDFGYFLPDQDNYTYYSLADSLPEEYRNFDETWRVFVGNEYIYFCTFRQIFRFKDNKLEKVISPTSPPENFHFVNQTLFINQLDQGLSILNNGELELFDNGSFFKGKAITGIIPLANNHLLISTYDDGIYTYDNSGFKIWNKNNHQVFAQSFVNNSIRLKNGNICIGTQNNGLFITDANGNINYHLNKGHGLDNRTILSSYQDIAGDLWVGHNNGISKVELSTPFTVINEEDGLPGTGYDGLYANNSTIYLGTNNGLYYKPNNKERTFKFIKSTEGQVYSIKEIDNLTLLGHHQGTFIVDQDKISQVSNILGAWTFLSLKDNPDYVIGGTYKGLILFKKMNNRLEFIRKIEGFTESSRVMQQDENGFIWMTHGYKGVYRLKLSDEMDSVSVKYYGTESGLPSKVLVNVWEIDDRLIFSTSTQIYIYDSELDKFVVDPFFKQFFDASSQISFMDQDALGNIYYLSNSEIGVLEKLPNGTYLKKNKKFNKLKGRLNDDLQDISVLSSNKVLYGAKAGFILYTKDDNSIYDIPFKTLIRRVHLTTYGDSVIANGYYKGPERIQSQQPKSSFPEISYDYNSIRIEYSAPFFIEPQNTSYQYKLTGSANESWSDWTTKTDKEYTNLKEGKYTFHVRAKNLYEEISEEGTFTFYVIPPWYRTKTAYAGYTFGVILLLTGIVLSINNRHQKEKRNLELEQEKALNQIDSELKSSEAKVEQLKNEKLKAEVESKNQELATSTMHLLNKNSFINSVKHNISTITKRSKNQEVKKELSKIMNNIEKNMAQDKDWEHFAIHFDQVHGDFTKRIQEDYQDLTPQEMKLSAYLRMNLSTKEIAHLLNISVRGVEIARYRLRKKLDLDRSQNLQEFILKY